MIDWGLQSGSALMFAARRTAKARDTLGLIVEIFIFPKCEVEDSRESHQQFYELSRGR